MKKDNVLSIIAMCSGLLIILSVFLPYVTLYSTSISLWESVASTRFIYIFLGCLVIGLYLLNIKTKMSYLTVGFAFFDSISTIISMNGFNDFSGIRFQKYMIKKSADGNSRAISRQHHSIEVFKRESFWESFKKKIKRKILFLFWKNTCEKKS